MSISCLPNDLAGSATCFDCIPRGAMLSVRTYLLCQWAGGVPAGTPVIPDGAGGFWALIVDDAGNLGTESTLGPATSDIILDDGSGGFWKVIVAPGGLRGTESDAGPATTDPTLTAPDGGHWTLVVDASGNLGTQSV